MTFQVLVQIALHSLEDHKFLQAAHFEKEAMKAGTTFHARSYSTAACERFSDSLQHCQCGAICCMMQVKKAAMEASAEINAKRKNRGLKPRPVRAVVIGFPNVGKSALINRLLNKRVCDSAPKPGVTRNLRWLRLGGDLDLLDAPGVPSTTLCFGIQDFCICKKVLKLGPCMNQHAGALLEVFCMQQASRLSRPAESMPWQHAGVIPASFSDQLAAQRLAMCNDIGEASYVDSFIAAALLEVFRELPAFAAINERLKQRFSTFLQADLSGECPTLCISKSAGDEC